MNNTINWNSEWKLALKGQYCIFCQDLLITPNLKIYTPFAMSALAQTAAQK